MRIILFILMLAVSVTLVLFGVQNTQTVEVRFLTYTTGAVSLSLVVILAAIAGALLVGLFTLLTGIRSSLRSRRMTRQFGALDARARELESRLQTLEKENATLRSRIPK